MGMCCRLVCRPARMAERSRGYRMNPDTKPVLPRNLVTVNNGWLWIGRQWVPGLNPSAATAAFLQSLGNDS